MELLILPEKLQVSATAFKAICMPLALMIQANISSKQTLQFDLVLDNQSLLLIVHWLIKLGRDGVMSSLVFNHKALVANHAIQH
jgi:hypothetical protein